MIHRKAPRDIFSTGAAMIDRMARLRNHELAIERYQDLLKTRLSDVEQHYVEKRLSEERLSVAMLQFIVPPIEIGNLPKAI
jgi:hypothetical protein